MIELPQDLPATPAELPDDRNVAAGRHRAQGTMRPRALPEPSFPGGTPRSRRSSGCSRSRRPGSTSRRGQDMKKPHRDRPGIEAAASANIAHMQQMREWMMAHKLQAHRGCTGFRIAELGLADLIASPGSDRSPHPGRRDGSGPRFASAATWRR